MPWVTIQWFDGRDAETKKRTLELVTKAICEGCGTTPEQVSVVFKDIKKSDWGRNGKLYAE
jgi:4-oxalocrotonate tautomerase